MSCVENRPVASQTDITFPDCKEKYLPLEKVYIHILGKIHEALFELKKWDCSFDKDSKDNVSVPDDHQYRDTIIRRAGKRDLPEGSPQSTSPKQPKLEPTTPAILSPEAFGLNKLITTISPDMSPPLVTAVKSPLIDTAGSPEQPGIVGVLCPTSLPVSRDNMTMSRGIMTSSRDVTSPIVHPPSFANPTLPSSFVNYSSRPLACNDKMETHLDELRTLRLALSTAIQNSEQNVVYNNDLNQTGYPFLKKPQPDLTNLLQFPPNKTTLDYKILDDAIHQKKEYLSMMQQKEKLSQECKEKLHQCPYCDAKFNQKSNLKTHVFGVHQFKLSTCRTCKIITSKEKLKEHMKLHPNRGYKCEQCDTSFDTHIRLIRHLKIHSAERPYQCTYCPKSFVYKWNLTEHVRIHTGEKPFVCRLCGKGFCQSSTLKRHSLAMHTTEKPYKCSQCEESFVRILLLKKHFVNNHLNASLDIGNSAAAQQEMPADALSMLHMLNNQT